MREEIKLPTQQECHEKFRQRFPHLSNDELSLLFSDEFVQLYKKGSIVYSEGARMKGCYFVYDGIVKIYQTGNEGKEQIIKFEKAGDFFGFRSVVLKEKACTSVRVLSDATLCSIPENRLMQLFKSNSDFAYELMQMACRELGDSNNYLRDIAQKSVKARLAEVLLMMSNDFGMTADGTLKLAVSREDLGNIVGTATESVIRLLSEFRNEGLVDAQKRKIKLLDICKLRKQAGM